ncbi:transmembrane protein 187 [Spea bombifrons]|uniref:transmembrane protein 187 n=1 Tax=Spea bombifrons TaxID=233779 RepID=UPI00234B945C|nr:transmembrane protein 187 [Spea bombifrons]
MGSAPRILSQDNTLWHVTATFTLCVGLVSTGILDSVNTELGFSHYAEKPCPWLPLFLVMPFNALVNLGYIILGMYWLCQRDRKIGIKDATGHYMKNVFSWMAILYGPVQWVRISTQSHWAAVLDQWFTLPIFAWAGIWCNAILKKWTTKHFLISEAISLSSYFVCLLHPQGFEMVLSLHILWAVVSGVRLQKQYGDASSHKYVILALASCLGFVCLKLFDKWLAQYFVFQMLTGHFWSKVCDILQFHYTFRFLTHLDRFRIFRKKE